MAADGLPDQHHRGDRQGQRQHVDHAGEVGDHRWPATGLDAQPGHQDRDEGEGLMSMKVDSPIGPQPQQLAEFAQVGGTSGEDAVLPVRRVARG